MIVGGVALLAGAGWLVKQKMSHWHWVANDNRVKITAILDWADPSLSEKVDKIKQLMERYDMNDPTVRKLIESEILDILDSQGNNGLYVGDGTVFRLFREDGKKEIQIIQSQEIAPGHTIKRTFTDTNWDWVFDNCNVEDWNTVSVHPCMLEDQKRISFLLDAILKAKGK